MTDIKALVAIENPVGRDRHDRLGRLRSCRTRTGRGGAEALTGFLTSLGAAIGGIIAIIGRLRAKSRIG
jgi:hypothetical protein